MDKPDMLDVVKTEIHEGKKRYYTDLARLRKIVNKMYDHNAESPCWMELEESFQELKDAYITWTGQRALLDIYYDA